MGIKTIFKKKDPTEAELVEDLNKIGVSTKSNKGRQEKFGAFREYAQERQARKPGLAPQNPYANVSSGAKMEIMEIIQVHMELKMVDLELLALHMELGLQHLVMELELVILPMIELEPVLLMVILEPVLRMEALLMELEGAEILLDLPRVRTHKPQMQMVKTQTLGMDRMLALRR